MKANGLKDIPSFTSDDEAENFVSNADLSNYDLSKFKSMKYEFHPKTEVINIRVPSELLASVKTKAK